MDTQELQAEITAITQAIEQLENSAAEAIVKRLLNLLERVVEDYASVEKELQELRDEINRLKGEHGKPNIKANRKKDTDVSSEDERKKAEAMANGDGGDGNGDDASSSDSNKKKKRRRKNRKIKIDREQICPLDKEGLPDDLEFKGYEEVVVQNIIIKTDNVKYLREVYYSPSQHQSYLGELPKEVRGQGEFGAGVRALIPILKAEGNMSEKKILGFFQNFGVEISPAYISQQWTSGYELFHQEKSDLYRAGLAASDYAQIDDTSARVKGVNHYCQVVCNPWFTAYFTTGAKDRRAVLGVLTDHAPPHYLYNQQAQSLLDGFNLSNKARAAVDQGLPLEVVMDEGEFTKRLASLDLGPRQSAQIAEACAITYYQQQTDFPVVDTLLADDAPQFKLLTKNMGLCWVHDGRHYKKLTPIVPTHQNSLADFRDRYWAYYAELLKYQRGPSAERKAELSKEFDILFTTTTGYEALDDRIAKTLAKKTELLRVLELPGLPLHNNAAELGARAQARSRDVSYQTRSEAGTKIKDTFMSINQTAKKLGVSFYEYVHDRVSGSFNMPSLAEIISQRAQGPPA
jgi:hypothetical protein